MSAAPLPVLAASTDDLLAAIALAALVVAALLARALSRAGRGFPPMRRSHRAVMVLCMLAAACLVLHELADLPWRVRMSRVAASARASAALVLQADDPPFEPLWDEFMRQLRLGGVPSGELSARLCAQPEERWRKVSPSDLVTAMCRSLSVLDEKDPLVGALLRALPITAYEGGPQVVADRGTSSIDLQVFTLGDLRAVAVERGYMIEVRPTEVVWSERKGDGAVAESTRPVLKPRRLSWSFSSFGRMGAGSSFQRAACRFDGPTPPGARLRLEMIISQFPPGIPVFQDNTSPPERKWTVTIDRSVHPAR